jgi:oligopeptide transport system permease protein
MAEQISNAKAEQFDSSLFQQVEFNEQTGDRNAGKSVNFWQVAWMRLRKNKAAIISLVLIIVIAIMSLAGPALSGEDAYTQTITQAKLPPGVTGLEWAGFEGMATLGDTPIDFY